MSELLKVFKHSTDDRIVAYVFYCPGCKSHHRFDIPRWTFNGNLERPTFSPSLLYDAGTPHCCHLFVRDGQIEYLSDSKHVFAGKTIPMEPHAF